MPKIKFVSTDLRDGHQQPGIAYNLEDRLAIAHGLAEINIDVIEAGFPSNSADREATYKIAQELGGKITISALARVIKGDIDLVYEGLRPAVDRGNAMIHTFIGGSEMLRQDSLGRKSINQILDMIGTQVGYAKERFPIVQFSPEDATRTPYIDLVKFVDAAVSAGASIINIPDTVGYAQPDEYSMLIRKLIARFPEFSDGRAILSVHCHDDLNLAVANSLAGIRAGALQIEGTVLGLGERAGNTDFMSVAESLDTRGDHYHGSIHQLDGRGFYDLAQLVSHIAEIAVAPNYPVVGRNAFAHSSGIHTNAVLNNPGTYQIMSPKDVGHKSLLYFGATSGTALAEDMIKRFGFEATADEVLQATELMKNYAISQKTSLNDAQAMMIIGSVLFSGKVSVAPRVRILDGSSIQGKFTGTQYASLEMQIDDETVTGVSEGHGVLESTLNAVNKIMDGRIKHQIGIVDYSEMSKSSGAGAQAVARMTLSYNGLLLDVVGRDRSVATAPLRAIENTADAIFKLESAGML